MKNLILLLITVLFTSCMVMNVPKTIRDEMGKISADGGVVKKVVDLRRVEFFFPEDVTTSDTYISLSRLYHYTKDGTEYFRFIRHNSDDIFVGRYSYDRMPLLLELKLVEFAKDFLPKQDYYGCIDMITGEEYDLTVETIKLESGGVGYIYVLTKIEGVEYEIGYLTSPQYIIYF